MDFDLRNTLVPVDIAERFSPDGHISGSMSGNELISFNRALDPG